MEAYQLLIPLEKEHLVDDPDREKQLLEQIAALVKEKQADLRKTIDESMDELLRNIIQIYAG
jgi:chorismate mutase